MANIEISYMYRDASNYKAHGAVIVSNPRCRSIRSINRSLEDSLEHLSSWPDILLLRPELVGLPTVFLFDGEFEKNEDDHCWHEINAVSETTKDVTDPAGRSVDQLLIAVRTTHRIMRGQTF